MTSRGGRPGAPTFFAPTFLFSFTSPHLFPSATFPSAPTSALSLPSSSTMASQALFTPIQVGDVTLQHRVAMAPLTRFRATKDHVHTPLGTEYYTQRASVPGTLIISEATFISPSAGGYDHAPGIYNPAQIAAWKEIVDAVHAKGSFIYLQLWHLGRAASPDVLKAEVGGPYDVVAPSALGFEGGATPRALTLEEIKALPAMYAEAARNFVEGAGGDGVEIHSANGYLIDQFLQTNSNKRTDSYGGSVENRIRLGLEVTAAVVAAVGAKKTAIRLSPFSPFQGMKMPLADSRETFSAYTAAIKAAHPDFAYIHVVEGRVAGNTDVEDKAEESLEFLRKIVTEPTVFVAAGSFKSENSIKYAEEHKNTVIAFGRYFISNPDLPARIQQGVELTPYNRDTFYLMGPTHPEGYTDYPRATKA
ncbi:NADPH2 dehydrogenase, partial [Phenoliferia sp. Uapishka_3]